ncbi:hypothetical protein G9A89_001259 [Geosiphon pyriformis]|nr:hypothetical protein G9A89_001259 [Geosiphon pyriformis]
MLGSTINILSTSTSTSHMTSTFGRLLFQSKQKKTELLGTYSNYFEEFKSQSPTPSGFQSLPLQPDFRTTSPWEITELEEKQKEAEESEDQEFTYQKLISKNPDIETPNFQT